jgi:hypothetical protein
MARVPIFLVKFTDSSTTEAILSRRRFTRKGAEMFERAILLEDTATDIDDGDLNTGNSGPPSTTYRSRSPEGSEPACPEGTDVGKQT